MKKKFFKVIPYIVVIILIAAAIWIGIGINASKFHYKEWVQSMKETKSVALLTTTDGKLTVAPTITLGTLDVNVIPTFTEIYTPIIGDGTYDNITGSAENDAATNNEDTDGSLETSVTTPTQTEVKETAAETVAGNAKIIGSFVISNSWEGHYMYDLSVENTGNTPVSSWEISLTLPQGCSIANAWCCNCSLTGNVLKITPESYNTYIGAGSKITGIGITIASNTELSDMHVDGKYNLTQEDIPAANETPSSNAAATPSNDSSSSEYSDNQPYKPPVLESGTPVSNHGKLTLSGTKLVDKNGKPYQLKGVSTHGLGWFPKYVNAEAFQTLRDEWGANMVRLAMYTAEYNGYCTGGNQAELKRLVENGVSYATELGMYVIIDWHVLNDRNPNTYKSQAIAFFEEMAAKYCNYDNVIYEICNEPNGGVDWNSINSYADDVIAAIRKYDSDAIILVGTPTWSQDIDQVAANPVKNGYNVMYTLHFYAATHKDNIQNKLKAALNAGTPAFVSEFSICDASGNGGIDYASAEVWKKLINDYNLSYAGWSLSNKAETSALIKNNCSKLSGWTTDELSDTGKWLRDMIAGN